MRHTQLDAGNGLLSITEMVLALTEHTCGWGTDVQDSKVIRTLETARKEAHEALREYTI